MMAMEIEQVVGEAREKGRICQVQFQPLREKSVESGMMASTGIVHESLEADIESTTTSIKKMFDTVRPLSSDNCIYRVPERLRSVNPEAYTPIIVSIGPFHRGDDRFKTMEHLKVIYLYRLQRRQQDIFLRECVKMLFELEREARNCYAETISFKKQEFVQMLLLDGCFLVELFLKYKDPRLREENDQLFKNHWIFNAVHRDVLLLENQIPFFVLERLFGMITRSTQYVTGTGMLIGNEYISVFAAFLLRYNTISRYCPLLEFEDSKVHLLHSVLTNITGHRNQVISARELSTGHRNQVISAQQLSTGLTFIPSATELSRVGITFSGTAPGNMFDVRFHNGIFYTPSLIVDDRTESFFRNLIALEQTHSKTNIDEKDIWWPVRNSILKGILSNQLGDDEEVAQLFNKFRTGIIMNPNEFCFSEVFEKVNVYYHSKWNEWKAIFYREFWSTPWRKTSLLVAIFLLICTLGQTICAFIGL